MSEFLEGGNQTAEEQIETPQVEGQQQSSPESGQENPNVSEPQFDIIKYNKEEAQIPVEKRQDYLQMGYHYEQKVKGEFEQMKEQNAYLDRMAKMSGFDTREELFEAIAEQERLEQIEREAEQSGMSVEQYEKFLSPVKSQLSEMSSKLAQYEQQEMIRNVDNEVMGLANKYEDFNDYKDQAFEIAIEKGYSLEDSYILASHAAKLESARVQAQQEAIQSLSTKQSNSVGSLSGGDGGVKSTVSALNKTDFEALKQKVLRGETKQL